MPHDIKGREIEFGDWIKARPYNYSENRLPPDSAFPQSAGKALPVVGRVIAMRQGQSCSGDFIWQSLDGLRRDSFGADEAEIILKANGTEPSDITNA